MSVVQELTADADRATPIRRNEGDANQKLAQQESLLLKAKVAHARQLLDREDNSDLLR